MVIKSGQALGTGALVLAGFGAYFAWILQIPQGTAFRAGLGDWIDPYFINALLEHWYRVLTRFADPASPPMFFPVNGTLGYSHGLVLFAPFYAIVRPFTHPFIAYTLALFLVIETGALCLYALLRRFAQLHVGEALALTMFFVSSPNVIGNYLSVWSQTASIFLVPPIVLIGLSALRMPPGPRALGLGALAGLLAALLMTQDAYTGLLTGLVSALFGAGVLVTDGVPATIRRIRAFFRAHPPSSDARRRLAARATLAVCVLASAWTLVVWSGGIHAFGLTIESHHHHVERPAALALAALVGVVVMRGGLVRLSAPTGLGAGAVAGVLVFLWIYLEPGLEHRAAAEEQLFSAIMPQQLSWHLLDLIAYDSRRPFYLAGLVAVLAWVPGSGVSMRVRRGLLWVVLVSALVVLIAVSFDRVSIWQVLFAGLPGFSVIRDPKRIIYAYEPAIALVAGVFAGRLAPRSPVRIALMLFVLGAIATTSHWTPFLFKRPIDTFDRWVRAPIAVDASCRSFFMKSASEAYMSRSGHMWSLYGVDATFIALDTGIPTLNGYSALVPPGWGLANPQGVEDYAREVRRWIGEHGLEHVCALDIDARTMTPFDSAKR